MASESITYDFTSRGADRLASDFRKTGDNAALAARGARLCADALALQEKAGKAAADGLQKAERASALLAVTEHELDAEIDKTTRALLGEGAAADLADKKAKAAAAGQEKLGKQLTGVRNVIVSKGGLFTALGAGAAALAAPVGAASVAFGAFGVLAAPTLDKVKKALTETGKQGQKAWAQLDPAQRGIAKNIQALEGQFKSMAVAFEPVVTSVTGGVAQLARAFLPSITPLARAGATVITSIITPLTALVGSGLFKTFIADLSQVAVQAGKLLGPLLVTALKSFITLFEALAPAGLQVLAAMQPLVGVLGQLLAQVLPPLGKAFANIAVAVVPLIPAVTAVASGLAQVIAAIPPGVLTRLAEAFLVIVGAVKAWSIAQAVLDVALNANPIGIIVTALAAAAAGFTLAWKKSAAFRDVIKTIGAALLEAGIIVVKADKIIVDSFLSMVGTVLHGAATAFGWVPGLGGLLKTASAHFDGFKATVDNGFNSMIKTMQGWQGELGRSRQATDAASKAIVGALTRAGFSASSARADVAAYTAALQHNQGQTAAGRSARQVLIGDLERAGVSASGAKRLVDNLQRSITGMHGKTVNVGVHASGSGGMTFTQKVAASISSGGFSLRGLASGGRITAGTGPTADDVPILASRGETVVSAAHSKMLAPVFRQAGVPGYASGGLVGAVNWTGGAEYNFARSAETALLRAEFAALKKAVAAHAKAIAAASSVGFASGPAAYGTAAAAQRYAKSILWAYGWGPGQFPPLLALWNRESGWNPYAVNPSSGAYGIPQSLGHGHPYALGDYANQVRWGLAYISGRYGSPAAAWSHELAYNWYDQGGMLQPGLTLAYNGTGRPEQVIPATGSGSGGTVVHVHLENSGVIGSRAELDNWLNTSIDRLARTGRLRYAIKRSYSAA